MSAVLVIDSSVAVKWFKSEGEQGLDDALELLRNHADESVVLAAPESLRLEVLNALWAARLSERDLRKAAEDLEGFRLRWFPVDGTLTAEAAALAVRHRITVYDGAFAALANALEAELVTADAALTRSRACRVRSL